MGTRREREGMKVERREREGTIGNGREFFPKETFRLPVLYVHA